MAGHYKWIDRSCSARSSVFCYSPCCFSQSLRQSAELVFTYLYGDDEIAFSQRRDIVQQLANITVKNGTNATSVAIVGLNAGSVIIGLNSTSTEFGE
jgi:hypothetical protein